MCRTECEVGFSLGSFIAVLCSWHINHSVLWAILHFFFGWFYVLYYIIKTGIVS